MIQHGFEDDDHNIKRWQRFKHSSFDLCYHLEARPGIGTSPGCFSSSGSPQGDVAPQDDVAHHPTEDCPGETGFPPDGELLSEEPLPHPGARQHLGGGGVSGEIWECRELQNGSQLLRRCSQNVLLGQFLQIGCQRCSRNEPDFHCYLRQSGQLLLQSVGAGQVRSRRRRRSGPTSLGRWTRRWTSWGRLGQRRPIRRRRSRLAGGCNRDPLCLDLPHDQQWRWK